MKKASTLRELKELCKELDIKLPPIATRAPSKIGRTQVIKLIRFAIENDFVITPIGYSYFVDSYSMFGCCPCDQERKSCPCPEAVEEVKTNGKCLCHLFWRDYKTYLEEKLKEK